MSNTRDARVTAIAAVIKNWFGLHSTEPGFSPEGLAQAIIEADPLTLSHQRLVDDALAHVMRTDAEIARFKGINSELLDACNGLIGLTQLIRGRDDLPPGLADVLNNSHRVIAAHEAVHKAEAA